MIKPAPDSSMPARTCASWRGSRVSTGSPADGSDGFALVAVLLALALLGVLGSTLLGDAGTDLIVAENVAAKRQSFYAAEAGLELAISEFELDRNWVSAIAQVNGALKSSFPPSVFIHKREVKLRHDQGKLVQDWYELIPLTQLANGATTKVDVMMAPLQPQTGRLTIQLRALGTAVDNIRATTLLEGELAIVLGTAATITETPWDNIIFADIGHTGGRINGHARIHGSVHVVGDPSQPEVSTIEFGGSAAMLNNYSGLLPTTVAKLPPLEKVLHNGEMVETLGATLKLKDATVTMDGKSSLGMADAPGAPYVKETLDLVQAEFDFTKSTDGTTPHIFADSHEAYDSSLVFPRLDGAAADQQWASHRAFLNGSSLAISQTSLGSKAFSYSDGKGNSISYGKVNNKWTLDIKGIVKVPPGFSVGTGGDVWYTGTGTIYSTGNVALGSNVRPLNNYLGKNSKDGNLGIIADGNISTSGTKAVEVFAAVYATGELRILKQSTLIGASVAGSFDMGANPPNAVHVPSLAKQLPPGMPGAPIDTGGGNANGVKVATLKRDGWSEIL